MKQHHTKYVILSGAREARAVEGQSAASPKHVILSGAYEARAVEGQSGASLNNVILSGAAAGRAVEGRARRRRTADVILSGAPKARSRRTVPERNYSHRTLFEKLGVTEDSRVALVGRHDGAFLTGLKARLATPASTRLNGAFDLIFFRVDGPKISRGLQRQPSTSCPTVDSGFSIRKAAAPAPRRRRSGRRAGRRARRQQDQWLQRHARRDALRHPRQPPLTPLVILSGASNEVRCAVEGRATCNTTSARASRASCSSGSLSLFPFPTGNLAGPDGDDSSAIDRSDGVAPQRFRLLLPLRSPGSKPASHISSSPRKDVVVSHSRKWKARPGAIDVSPVFKRLASAARGDIRALLGVHL